MLGAIVIGGAGDFRRQAGQRIADHHRQCGHGFIHLLGVSAAQSHEAVRDLLMLGIHEGNTVLLGDRRRHCTAADGDAASEEAATFDV